MKFSSLKLSLLLSGALLAPTITATARAAAPDAMGQTAPPNITTLPNGVVFVPTVDRTAPRVAISILVGQGAADETPATAGWRRLLVSAMLAQAPEGYEVGDTKTEKDESLSRTAEKLNGDIGATVGDDVIEFFVSGESANGVDLLKLALALIQKPRLSDATLDEVRARQIDRVGAEDLNVTTRIEAAIRSQVFRDKTGALIAYGLPDNGTAQSLEALDNAQLRALQTQLTAAPLTVSAVGDVDVEGMKAVLQTLPIRDARAAKPLAFVAPKAGAPPLVVRELATDGAFIFVSYPLPAFDLADAAALRVLVAALSDAKGARLPSRLSGDNLIPNAPEASSVSAQWLDRRYASEVLITAQTDAQSVEGVKNVLLDEVRKLRETPLSTTELERAKAFARGDYALDRQSLRDRAFLSGRATAINAPPDATWPARVQAVSAADVKRVANQYLKAYAVALVMPKG